jgi:predicted Zn finger-like uncharacterized protein
MIVTCPSCSTRYIVDPKALGASGRMVRCASCKHTWMQAQPVDMPRPVDVDPAPDSVRPIPPGSNLPAFTQPQRTGPAQAIGWLALLVVLFGGGVGLIVARNDVVALWPPAARLYDIVGLPLEAVGAGLELRNVSSARREDGPPVIVVEGTVANVSSKPREVPRLKAVVRSAAHQDLKNWTFTPGVLVLLPGETANFKAELADPPRGATDLAITFTAG